MKKWVIENKFQENKLIEILLENRGIKTKKEIEEFLNPKLEDVTSKSVGIDQKELKKAIVRIRKAIKEQEQIIVFGDYDVDGICGTAVLWEALNSLSAKVLPYIPHRVEEGYGLSKIGISNIKSQISNVKLIITVDNGIVANEAVDFAKTKGIDVIITDHHLPSKKLPKALAIVHTTKVCGAGVAYLLSQEISNPKSQISNKSQIQNTKFKILNTHLELVALATVADMVPLVGANRTLVKFGLEELKKTKRPGLLELFKEAVIDQSLLGVYQIGHMIAPRLNATGRIDYAMEALRLLCTPNKQRAKELALKLGETNKERQELTLETTQHAKMGVKDKLEIKKLLFIVHESYQPGVIGLVAGKLVDEFYRPAIVVSKGEKISKASARSIRGFNIIEFIRGASELLIDAGGHPMAAGFTVETDKLLFLQKKLEDLAEELIDGEKLTRTLRVDCELPLSIVDEKLYDEIQKLSPFGMGNPEPIFVSKNVVVEDSRLVGRDGKHLKMNLKFKISNLKFQTIGGIGFGMGEKSSEIKIGDKVNIAFTIDQNVWNGDKKLQLKIKDIKN